MLGLLKRHAAAKGRIGIALGEDRLAVAVVRRDTDGTPRLERCESVPVPARERAEAMTAALRELGLPPMPVSGVLRAQDYQLALVESPDVPPAELRAAMRWRLRDSIDFRVEDAVIDVFDIPPQSRGSQGRMLYAVAARRAAIDQHSAALASLGGFDVIDVPELCLRNLAGLLPAANAGVAMLHLGESSASVVLVRGATFYFARQMSLQQSLNAALEAGAGGRVNGESVMLELQRSLDYYERHFDQPPITRITLAPAGPRAQTLAADLSQESSFEVGVLDLNELLPCARPIEPEEQSACLLAVGAALRREHRSL
ncbi:MAG: hypothetical protein U1F35_05950 [Steroidobacteraceae bacterium]